MMRELKPLLAGLLALGLAQPIGAAGGEGDGLDSFRVPPGAVVPGDYRKTFDHVAGPLFSGMHWNHFIRVYIRGGTEAYRHNSREFQRFYQSDEDWMEDLPEPEYHVYPAGTVIIKENFREVDDAPGATHTLTIMIKQAAGYDPGHGDWEYVELDRRGRTSLRGNSRQSDVALRCANCHESVRDRDYVFAIEAGK